MIYLIFQYTKVSVLLLTSFIVLFVCISAYPTENELISNNNHRLIKRQADLNTASVVYFRPISSYRQTYSSRRRVYAPRRRYYSSNYNRDRDFPTIL